MRARLSRTRFVSSAPGDPLAAATPAALLHACARGVGACSTQRRTANMQLAQSDVADGLSLPAALLKRTRCDSPGAVDAHASDGAYGFDVDDTGAPAVDLAVSGLGASVGAATAQQAASPLPGGKSPPRGANKSPRWRAHGSAASSPLGEGARGVQSGRGTAEVLAPAAASPAPTADASPSSGDDGPRASAGGGTEQEAEQRCVTKACCCLSAECGPDCSSQAARRRARWPHIAHRASMPVFFCHASLTRRAARAAPLVRAGGLEPTLLVQATAPRRFRCFTAPLPPEAHGHTWRTAT